MICKVRYGIKLIRDKVVKEVLSKDEELWNKKWFSYWN